MASEVHAGRPLEVPSYTPLPAEAPDSVVSPRFTRRRIATCAAAFGVTLAALAVAHWAFMFMDHSPMPRKSAVFGVIPSPSASSSWSSQELSQASPESPVTALSPHASQCLLWSGMGERQHLLSDMYALYEGLTGQKWKYLGLYTSGKSGDRHLPLPEPRWKAAVAQLDSESPALVLHGGSKSQNESGEEYFSDVWKLELSAAVEGRGGWEPSQASKNPGDGKPSARRAHSLVAFQTARQTNHTLVLFGGRSPGRAVLNDVWTAQMDTWPTLHWTLANPAAENEFSQRHRPSPRKGHVAVAGELRGRTVMLVHGGRDDDTYMGDVWAFDVEQQAWELLETSGDQPPPRDHHGGVFYNGFFYVFGGRTGEYHSQFICLDDLWRLDLKILRWDRVVGGGGNGKRPLPRFLYSTSTIVDAEGRAKFVVFGGETQFRCKLNDVWDLDLATGLWTQWHQATMSDQKCRQLLA